MKLFRFFTLAFICSGFFASSALAKPIIFGQFVKVDFQPARTEAVFFLDARIEKYHATTIALDSAQGIAKYFAATSIPAAPAEKTDVILGFFKFYSENEQLAVSELFSERVGSNLLDDSQDLAGSILLLKNRLSELEQQTEQIYKHAASVAGVDAIIDLESELAELEQVEEAGGPENIERLRVLLEHARHSPSGGSLNQIREGLNQQLYLAAKATASVDKVRRSRQDKAQKEFIQKLSLIREMKRADLAQLAEEVRSLRKRRREYEQRLGRTQINEDLR